MQYDVICKKYLLNSININNDLISKDVLDHKLSMTEKLSAPVLPSPFNSTSLE